MKQMEMEKCTGHAHKLTAVAVVALLAIMAACGSNEETPRVAPDAGTRDMSGDASRDMADTRDSDIGTTSAEVPIVVELGLYLRHANFRGGVVIPAGGWFALELQPVVLNDANVFPTASDYDIDWEVEGPEATFHQSGWWVSVRPVEEGNLRVRFRIEQERLDAPVYSEWYEIRVEPEEEYDWGLLARVEQPSNPRGMLDEPVVPGMKTNSAVFQRLVPPDQPARIVPVVLWKRKDTDGRSYNAVRGNLLEFDVEGVAVDADGIASPPPGMLDFHLSHTLPSGRVLEASESVEVKEHPPRVLHVRAFPELPRTRNFVVASSTMSRSELPSFDEIFEIRIFEIDTGGFAFTVGKRDLPLDVTVQHAAEPIEELHNDLRYRGERWQDPEGRTYHSYTSTYLRTPDADEVVWETVSDQEGFDSETQSLLHASDERITEVIVEVSDLAAALRGLRPLNDAEKARVEFSSTPASLSFTDWNQCRTFQVAAKLDGEDLSEIFKTGYDTCMIRSEEFDESLVFDPVKGCMSIDHQDFEMCTMPSASGDPGPVEGAGSASISHAGISQDRHIRDVNLYIPVDVSLLPPD